ncbi:AbiJ-NTD4 domain-containing protein [Pseudomonas syringae]|uniref:AbiJ-NTD4 domain-containing protein n=1 Tax=Pseudomonas syringae TaxID=317 RepID=UPI0006CB3110|nr:hypothetical protein [Pseudomonas syringae]ALE01049.1 hypothetical protein PSYRMG_25300 [Pseudomonas syringae UMAF0158]MCK9731915.1 hypothetical protein [Pseudomonas syringae pv. syringae]
MEGDFSQRMGFVPMKPDVQLDDINGSLRTALWNVLLPYYLNYYKPREGSRYDDISGSNRQQFAMRYYAFFLKRPVDELPRDWTTFVSKLRDQFFRSMSWHQVYSLIEFVIQQEGKNSRDVLMKQFNGALEWQGSGYRVVNGYVVPITSTEELGAIEDALSSTTAYQGIGEHLSAAVRMLSDKQNPDYRNSIKESISAVECLARHLTGDPSAVLGQALKVLEKRHHLHPALNKAFSSLYGYTNDANGIRHSLMDDGTTLTSADARWMLISCSAFINFAIDSTKE